MRRAGTDANAFALIHDMILSLRQRPFKSDHVLSEAYQILQNPDKPIWPNAGNGDVVDWTAKEGHGNKVDTAISVCSYET